VSNYTNQTQNAKSEFSKIVGHCCSVVGRHLDSCH